MRTKPINAVILTVTGRVDEVIIIHTSGNMAKPDIPVSTLCIFVLLPPSSGNHVQSIWNNTAVPANQRKAVGKPLVGTNQSIKNHISNGNVAKHNKA